MAPHSSTLAWKIPWTEEPGGLQSMGSLGVRHNWATSLSLFTFMHWRRKWQPTPVFLPGESQGRRSLVGCCLWGRTESDTTEAAQQQQQYMLRKHALQQNRLNSLSCSVFFLFCSCLLYCKCSSLQWSVNLLCFCHTCHLYYLYGFLKYVTAFSFFAFPAICKTIVDLYYE